MAENESLDLGKSRRWKKVIQAVLDDKPTDDIAAQIIDCLYKTIKGLRDPLFKGGPPQLDLSRLIDAYIQGQDAMRQEIRHAEGHEYARLFEACSIDAPSKQVAVENFLSAICERFSDQIIEKVNSESGLSIYTGRNRLSEATELTQSEIKKLAEKIVKNPSNAHKRPSTIVGMSSADTKAILSQSLLGN